jgi:4-oxalocrotonate tautomerase
MPLIQIHLAAGRSAEEKRAMMENITKGVVEALGVDPSVIRIWITEIEPTGFMAGGVLLADKLAQRP